MNLLVEDMNDLTPTRFYAYYDDCKKKYFYHNPINNDTTWIFPKDSFVIDPEANQIISCEDDLVSYDEPLSSILFKASIRNSSCNNVTYNSKISNSKKYKTLPRKKYSYMKLGDIISVKKELSVAQKSYYIPPSLEADLKSNKGDFSNLRLREYSLKKTKLSPESLLTYELKSHHIPLLAKTTNIKVAEATFQLISNYGIGKTNEASPLLSLISSNKDLVDEVFLQLIKQSRNNTNNECTHRVYNLLLLVSQYFGASDEVFPFLMSYFAKMSNATQKQIAKLSMKCYIHLESRHASKWIVQIPPNPEEYHPVIGTSLYELIYDQYRNFPDCPLPIFLIRLTTAMCAKCVRTNSRKETNMEILNEIISSLNRGNESLIERSDLCILIAVFEQWLARLSSPLIPNNLVQLFKTGLTTQTLGRSCDKLPFVNKMTLGYIVGFIKEINSNEKIKDEMTLEVTVGSQLIKGDNEAMKVADMELGGFIFSGLIKHWDVSFVYPLPAKFMLRLSH